MTDQPEATAKLHKVLDFCIRNGADFTMNVTRRQVQLDFEGGAGQSVVLPFHLLGSFTNSREFKEL